MTDSARGYAARISTQEDVFNVDDRFFAALLAADGGALDELLVEDFVIVDVLSGSVADKSDLIPLVASAALAFDEIDRHVHDRQVRLHDATAIVVGRTHMRGRYQGQAWSAASRYVHVFTRDATGWRMASAQGTPIVDAALPRGD